MVGSFGQFHYWNSTDRRKVRSLVRASFPDNALVPRSVTFREFANWGDVMVSRSAGCYILSGEFAGAMILADEDPMPPPVAWSSGAATVLGNASIPCSGMECSSTGP